MDRRITFDTVARQSQSWSESKEGKEPGEGFLPNGKSSRATQCESEGFSTFGSDRCFTVENSRYNDETDDLQTTDAFVVPVL